MTGEENVPLMNTLSIRFQIRVTIPDCPIDRQGSGSVQQALLSAALVNSSIQKVRTNIYSKCDMFVALVELGKNIFNSGVLSSDSV